ncbi:hypothetical protein BJF92_14475 [Rhizobium rhizosphaerae]|uniref:Uncharacterized protein n=1 Tax=Xaviernesmea rhizosphaerae TaxID=1672749 RepID=A0A1Q9ACI6_9HYPH|nr:hypothetical protein BJF92_14475 [Xaviernesmea rhizosphaerae]
MPKVYRIALDLVQDKRVAPSARAKLISDLFRAAGLYADTDDDRQKEPHEMTAGELEQAIRDLEGKTRPTLFD